MGGPIFFYLVMLALVVTIGVIDYLLGYGLSMVGFYVFPVGLVTWRGGKGIGSFYSILSAVGVYVATTLTPPPHVPAIYPEWKAGESLFFLLVITWLVASRKQEQEKRERLMAQLQESAIVEERNRMAGEIHDTLAQGFTGIVVQLEAADDILKEDVDSAKAHIDRARNLARQSLAEARRSVQALRVPELKSGGLNDAIKLFIRQITAGTSTVVESVTQGTPYALPPEVEFGLLRICQEAVVNCLRHAKAGKIAIELCYEPSGVGLSIKDNGQGFDTHISDIGGGFGLIGMRERAKRIGINLEVQSFPGTGTNIVASVRRSLPAKGVQTP